MSDKVYNESFRLCVQDNFNFSGAAEQYLPLYGGGDCAEWSELKVQEQISTSASATKSCIYEGYSFYSASSAILDTVYFVYAMSLFLTNDESFVPFRRPSVDIRGQSVAPDVLVALLDRPGEMHALTLKNQHFYTALKHYITETQGLGAWNQFEAIVYAPREEICDRDWMDAISRFLVSNPVFLTKFKESVGYDEDDDEDDDEGNNNDSLDTSSLQSSSPGVKPYKYAELPLVIEENIPTEREEKEQNKQTQQRRLPFIQHPHARLLALRVYPDIQSRLQYMCPAYFRKAQHLMSLAPSEKRSNAARRNSILEEEPRAADEYDETAHRFDVDYGEGGNARPFDHFKNIVTVTRWEQPDDDAWVDAVVESLDGWPELLEDLEEIASSLRDGKDDPNEDSRNSINDYHHGHARRRESVSDVYIS
ncbi:hypothetical protein BX666DRAFT_2123999, partial [Dichotomocladium elegans]